MMMAVLLPFASWAMRWPDYDHFPEMQRYPGKQKSGDQKLFEVFRLLKPTVREQNIELYYVPLGWADTHKAEFCNQVPDYFKK